MVPRLLAYFASIALHAVFAVSLFLVAPGAALHAGPGLDLMFVEQGIALDGLAKLGEDQMSLEEVEATPITAAAPQPLPEEVKPIEELPVVASETGLEQENIRAPDVEDVKEAEAHEKLEEPDKEVVEQPLPPQVAAVQQESVVAMRESSGQEMKGGDATSHSAYLGALRTHLEKSKVNPRSNFVGTAIVRFTVNASGEVLKIEIATSSGKKPLDDAAIASVQKAAPFPAMPSNLHRDTMEISVPFRFVAR
jgi:protein TonB